MRITISQTKKFREELGATHVVVLAITEDGKQHVATHGKTQKNAKEAADLGNRLKGKLGWPPELCRDSPLKRMCENCVFWKADYGIFCMNGWSDDGSVGFCRYEPSHVKTTRENLCGHFEPRC